jgi:predicted anti-sigma-YlaC factor YlaD
MTCKATISVICEYLEGKLAAPVSMAVNAHLRTCKNCKMVHETAQRTLQAYFDDDVVRVPSPHAEVA